MVKEPSVSVIIPTYNRARFIPIAVQSVLDQTFRNVEIVVVDDGSTDDTRRALEPFKEKISYFVTENKGAAHARNFGMKAAGGKYIAFLDSDDCYLPHKLELQISFMEAHPEVGMVSTEVSSLTNEGISEEYHLRSFHSIYNRKGWSYEDLFPVQGKFDCRALNAPVPFYIGQLFRYVLQGPVVMSNTILFPKEILKHTGYQNESYRLAEEYELIVRICKYYEVAFLDIPTYLYRYHDHQLSKVNQPKTRKKISTEIETEEVILQAILDWGYKDKAYYSRNYDWLNHQLAEQYLCLGQKWLDYGNAGKARECFRIGHTFEPTWRQNRVSWWFSFLPNIVKRGINWIARKRRKWIF